MNRGLSPALSWATLSALTVIVGCLTQGTDTDKAAISVGVSDVLAATGPEVVLPAVEAFLAEVDALEAALADTQRDTATTRDQFAAVMLAWQELEVMQIGPAGSSLDTIAGADLRDEIYSWPTINPCRVDQETVEADWDSADFFEANLVNSYGLDALEYLLWDDLDNDCPSQVDINADGTWGALGDEGVAQNRADFARALTAQLRVHGEALHTAWSADGDDFSGQLALTNPASPYSSEQEALNAVFDALFYLETATKDRKLAHPLGEQDCSTETCVEDVEHLYSGLGAAAIEANLLGFESLFTGGAGFGLDDLLVEVGHGDLSEQILADLAAAQAAAAAITVPLDEAIEAQPADVQALHDAVKLVCDALKGDLATVLVLEIPAEAAGDND